MVGCGAVPDHCCRCFATGDCAWQVPAAKTFGTAAVARGRHASDGGVHFSVGKRPEILACGFRLGRRIFHALMGRTCSRSHTSRAYRGWRGSRDTFRVSGHCGTRGPALLHDVPSVLFGVGMLLAASVAWSIVIIVARRARPAEDGLLMVSWQSIWACVLLVPAAIILDGAPSFSGEAADYASIAFVGVFATALAFVGTLWLASRISALAMSIGMLSVPALSILLSAILLQERPDTGTLIGLAAIVAGVAALKLSRPQSSDRHSWSSK